MAWKQYFDWSTIKLEADTLQEPSNLVHKRNFLSALGLTLPLQTNPRAYYTLQSTNNGGNILLQTQGNTQRVDIANDLDEEVIVDMLDFWFGSNLPIFEVRRLEDRIQALGGTAGTRSEAEKLVSDSIYKLYENFYQKIINNQTYIIGQILTNRIIPFSTIPNSINQKPKNNVAVQGLSGPLSSGVLSDFSTDPMKAIAEHISASTTTGTDPQYVILGSALAQALRAYLTAHSNRIYVPEAFFFTSPDYPQGEIKAKGAYMITDISGVKVIELTEKVQLDNTLTEVIGANTLSVVGNQPFTHQYAQTLRTNGDDDSVGSDSLYISFHKGIKETTRDIPFECSANYTTLPTITNTIYTTNYDAAVSTQSFAASAKTSAKTSGTGADANTGTDANTGADANTGTDANTGADTTNRSAK